MTHQSVTDVNMSKGITELLIYTNSVTNQWISNLILIGVWVLVLMGFYKAQNDFKGALAVAGYTTFVISLFFWIGGFVSSIAFGMCIAMAIIGTLVLLLDNN